MNILEYYKVAFPADLKKIPSLFGNVGQNSISIIAFFPDENSHDFDQWNRFQIIAEKRRFLTCFFFCSLLDQAVHSGLNEEHRFFDELAQYPKFVGILGSAHSNLNPFLLLLLATIYTLNKHEELATKEFRLLADFFIEACCELFETNYPFSRKRSPTIHQSREALLRVFGKMSPALSPLEQNESWLITKINPNLKLCNMWLSYFDGLVNSKIKHLDSLL